MNALADNVRDARATAGLSMNQLAERARVAKGTLAEIESGKNTNPKLDALTRLAGALDTSVDGLLGAATQVRTQQEGGPNQQGPLRMLSLDQLVAWPGNPRRLDMSPGGDDDEGIKDLAHSIDSEGLLEPLVVVGPDNHDSFMVIGGQRRHAALMWLRAQDDEGFDDMLDGGIPCRIVEAASEAARMTIALAENLARRDMTPAAEARAFRALIDGSDGTIGTAAIAYRVARDVRWVQKRLKLLELPEVALDALDRGEISVRQAEALLAAYNGVDRADEAADKGAGARLKGALNHVLAGRLTTEAEIREQLQRLRDVADRHWAAKAQADIEDGAAGGVKSAAQFRHTPPDVDTLDKILPVGTRIRTSYGTGGIVESVSWHYVPGDDGNQHAAWSITYRNPGARNKGHLNDFVHTGGGRIQHLVPNNDDEIFIVDDESEAPPPEDPRPSFLREDTAAPPDNTPGAVAELAGRDPIPKQWDELGITRAEWQTHQDMLERITLKEVMVIGWEEDEFGAPWRVVLRLSDGARTAFATEDLLP